MPEFNDYGNNNINNNYHNSSSNNNNNNNNNENCLMYNSKKYLIPYAERYAFGINTCLLFEYYGVGYSGKIKTTKY